MKWRETCTKMCYLQVTVMRERGEREGGREGGRKFTKL